MPPHDPYTPAIVAEILDRLTTGESLRQICLDAHMPARKTVSLWIANNREQFGDHYARAKADGCNAIGEEIFAIADDAQNDYMEGVDPRTGEKRIMLDQEHIQRSKLRIDARKWYLSHIAPKIYGEKQTIEHTGDVKITERLIGARKRA